MSALPRRRLAAALLVACGPEPADSDTESTGGSTTTTTDTPTTGEPFTPAVCDAPADDVDPFPDPATCEDFPGSVGVAELEIGIINLRSEPVFVMGSTRAIERRVVLTGELGGRPAVVHARGRRRPAAGQGLLPALRCIDLSFGTGVPRRQHQPVRRDRGRPDPELPRGQPDGERLPARVTLRVSSASRGGSAARSGRRCAYDRAALVDPQDMPYAPEPPRSP